MAKTVQNMKLIFKIIFSKKYIVMGRFFTQKDTLKKKLSRLEESNLNLFFLWKRAILLTGRIELRTLNNFLFLNSVIQF